jgi:hypothetical protein
MSQLDVTEYTMRTTRGVLTVYPQRILANQSDTSGLANTTATASLLRLKNTGAADLRVRIADQGDTAAATASNAVHLSAAEVYDVDVTSGSILNIIHADA